MMKKTTGIIAVLTAIALFASTLSGCIGPALLFGAIFGTAEEESTENPETAAPKTEQAETDEPETQEVQTDEPETVPVASETEKETEPETEAFDEEETDAFREFTTEVMVSMLEGNTLNVHFRIAEPENYGIDTSEVFLGSLEVTEEDQKEYSDFLKDTLEAMQDFDYDALSWEGKLTYDSLKWYLETELESEGLDLYYEPLAANSGLPGQLPLDFEEYQFYRESDVTDYLELLRQVPRLFRELVAFEKKKAEAGLFMEDGALENAIGQCTDFIENREDSFLLSSFEERLEELDLSEERKAGYIAENRQIILEVFYPAYEDLITALSGMKGLNQVKGGLCNYPEGKEYFTALLKAKTGSDMTPEEMIKRVKRAITSEIEYAQSLYAKNPRVGTVFSRDVYPTRDTEESLTMLKDLIREEFPEIQDVSYELKYLDEALGEYLESMAACYMIPPIDRPGRNTILVNCQPGDEPEDLFITLAHEGYPGHLYQFNYMKENATFPIRSIIGPIGAAEGYAKYVENRTYHYIEDLSDAEAEYLAINARVSLLLYARVDLGIHYEGWTVSRIIAFMEPYFMNVEEIAEWMYYYMLSDPCIYEEYAIGELEILDMQKEAEKREGYSILSFHKALLDCSEAPFSVVRKNILGTEK